MATIAAAIENPGVRAAKVSARMMSGRPTGGTIVVAPYGPAAARAMSTTSGPIPRRTTAAGRGPWRQRLQATAVRSAKRHAGHERSRGRSRRSVRSSTSAGRTIANMTPSVSAAQRSSAVARSTGHIDRSSPMPRRSAIGTGWRRPRRDRAARRRTRDRAGQTPTCPAPYAAFGAGGTHPMGLPTRAIRRLVCVGYTRRSVSTLHTRYASERIRGDPWPRPRRGSPATDPSRTSSRSCPAPRPGRTSRSTRRGPRRACPRAYPIVPVRGEGLTVEDIDGNLFLDFAAGIAVNSTGHAHPQVVAAIKEQAAELIHFSASDFYLPIYPEVCRQLARLAPFSDRARVYLGNSGRGGRGGLDQARPLRDEATVRRRVPRRVPRPDLRRRLADRVEGEVPRRVRAAAAGRLPRAVRAGRGPALVRRGPVRQARAGRRGRGDHRRADPGRGRLHRPRGRVPPGAAPDLRRARDPAHRRRDPVGRRPDRQDVGGRALGRRARHPADRQGHRLGDAARRDDRPRRAAGDAGARAPTARRTAATRSPARRPWRRSSCSRAGSSRTPRPAASRPWPGSATLAGALPGARSATSAARA